MPVVNATTRSLQIKIVYYGPGLSGKTTNLEQLSRQLDSERVGELMALDTTGDRTLFFDWIPVDLGQIKGFDVRVQLFTVPGQVRYNNTRKKVLQGVDGVVFVADSQQEAVDQDRYAFQNLRENLAAQGIDLEDVPLVVQWNKGDLPTAIPAEDLAVRLNLEHYPHVSAIASEGKGVRETLRQITRLTLSHVRSRLDPSRPVAPEEDDESDEAPPMDGDAMMERIMVGGDGPPEPDPNAQVPDVEIAVESGEDFILGGEEVSGGLVDERLVRMERDLAVLARSLQSLSSQLPIRVADQVEREGEQTREKVGDLESRLGILQRVVTRLGSRMDVLERRAARLEIQGQGQSRSADLEEMASHFHDLSRIMAAFARRLSPGRGGQPGSTPVTQAERSDEPGDND